MELHEPYPSGDQLLTQMNLQKYWADAIWSMMTKGKYYSVKDLANMTGQERGIVIDIVDFLTEYGFIEEAGWNDSIYTKSKIDISPAKSVELLKTLVSKPI